MDGLRSVRNYGCNVGSRLLYGISCLFGLLTENVNELCCFAMCYACNKRAEFIRKVVDFQFNLS